MKWIDPVQSTDMDIQTVNFLRVKKLLPVLAGMSLVMFGLALAIHDDLSVRIINGTLLGLFMILTLLIYLLICRKRFRNRYTRKS